MTFVRFAHRLGTTRCRNQEDIVERRKALAVAGTVAGTLAAAGAAMAVNFGLLGAQASEVGNLDVKGAAALVSERSTTSTTESEPEVTVIYQDVPVAGSAASGGSGSSGSSGFETSGGGAAPAPAPDANAPAPAPPPTPAYSDDDGDDHGDDYDDDDHGDDHDDDVEEPDDDD